jgi:site-specific recombinase XerD
LRHTFTTRLVEAGVNIKVIQNLCGHTRSDITLDIYTTVTKELKQREFGNFSEKMAQQRAELDKLNAAAVDSE